jgi:hypothetical protein
MAQRATGLPRPPDEEPDAIPDNPNAWLEPLIGAGCSDGPTDVASNIHKYVAEAVLHELFKPDPA